MFTVIVLVKDLDKAESLAFRNKIAWNQDYNLLTINREALTATIIIITTIKICREVVLLILVGVCSPYV